MQITLTHELEKSVNTAITSCGFDDAEDYITEALKYYYQLKIDRLNAALATGFDQLERGEGVPYDRDRLDKKIQKRLGKRISNVP